MIARVIATAVCVGVFTACAPRIVRAPQVWQPAIEAGLPWTRPVWVAGFLTSPTRQVDLNTESVRLLREALRSTKATVVIDADPLAIRAEETFADGAYWRRMAEEHDFPLIVTGSVKLLVAPPAIVQRGRNTSVQANGRVLQTTVVVIDGRTGAVVATEPLPRQARYGVGRFSSEISLYFDLMRRALPDWLRIIVLGSRPRH